jgi:hypothetical protein
MKSKISEDAESAFDTPYGERGIEETKSFRDFLKDADTSELLSFSKYTLFGVVLVILALIIWVILMSTRNPNSDKIGLGILSIFSLVFLLGLVVDILRWRDFTEWSAIGVIVADIGFIFIIVPLSFNMLPVIHNAFEGLARENLLILPEFNISLYEVLIIIGALFVMIGFTSHATEYDRKIKDLVFLLGMRIRHFQKREALKTLGLLIWSIISGTGRAIGNGFRNLKTRFTQFGKYLYNSFKTIVAIGLNFFTKTFPRMLWNNLHWFGLIALFLILLTPTLTTNNFYIDFSLLIIGCFFFLLGILYSYQDRVISVVDRARNAVFQGVISAYSMLSGAELKYHQAVYCSRCLRGMERNEFTSLQQVKDNMNPPCPFCGHDNWIIPTERVTFREQLDRDIQEIGSDVRKSSIEEFHNDAFVTGTSFQSDSQSQKSLERKTHSSLVYAKTIPQDISPLSELHESSISSSDLPDENRTTFPLLDDLHQEEEKKEKEFLPDTIPIGDQEPQSSVKKDDILLNVANELLKSKKSIPPADKEAQDRYDWFSTQTSRYKDSKLSKDVYKTNVMKYQSFLAQKLKEHIVVQVESSPPESIVHVSEDKSDPLSFDSILCAACGESNQAYYVHCVFCGVKLKK